MMTCFLYCFFVLFISVGQAAKPLDQSLRAPTNLKVSAPTNDGGTRLKIQWEMPRKWSFYIMDGDRIVGVVDHDKRAFDFKGNIEDVDFPDEESRLEAQKSATQELSNRLKVLWVDPSKLPTIVNASDIERSGQLLTHKIELDPKGKIKWSIPSDSFRLSLYRLEMPAGHTCEESDVNCLEKGKWKVIKSNIKGATREYIDTVTDNPRKKPPEERYWYKMGVFPAGPASTESGKLYEELLVSSMESEIVSGKPHASWVKKASGIYLLFALILAVGILMFHYTRKARSGAKMAIRRIPGIDAIEEGIGRATEMGKPVLYVPGIDSLEDIQTIASMLVLGEISKTIAEYQADVIVSCCIPIVREVADEVVKAGFYRAGHPDAFDPTSVRFISSEQFAFCAGTNGIMYRQKPATNIYLGRFFAESLILAETGYVNRAIQIAGTAEASQLPFFIAACDYTLIGEELFAVSAYLSGDPRLVSSLKASDVIKLVIVALLAIGVCVIGFGFKDFLTWFNYS